MNKLIPATALLLILGCAHDPMHPDHGYSVSHNLAVQAHDPEAHLYLKTPPPMSGGKAAAAVDRYLQDDGKLDRRRIIDNISN